MSEFNEPWEQSGCCIWSGNGEPLLADADWDSPFAARTIACVNALAGVPTERISEVVKRGIECMVDRHMTDHVLQLLMKQEH